MSVVNNFTPDARYSELDRREEQLKRELETVRDEKRQIAQRYFSGSAPAEAIRSEEANARVSNTEANPSEDMGRSELPARTPLILQSSLP